MMESVNSPYRQGYPIAQYLQGNSAAPRFRMEASELQADSSAKKANCIRIWGRVRTYENVPVEAALVALVKMVCDESGCWLVGVAHTITDCKGFYQFDIYEKEDLSDYRVIIGKAATGTERVIKGNSACNP